MWNCKLLTTVCLVLAGFLAIPMVAADDRGYGARSRGYDRGNHYGPRYQPVLPTRPLYMQPSRRDSRYHDGRHGYGHGYRDGYRHGYSDDRDDHRWSGRRGYSDRHYDNDARGHGYYGHGYRGYPQPNYYGRGNYYAPRPGFSIYYNNR